ncbi:MAG: hypothetical protein WCV70_01525 [Patescibacteria group bacterium]|jgi:hypothetical protein
MKNNINKKLYWSPRILAILFIIFLALMSLDVFSLGLNFWQTITALLIHNIPAFILLAILLASWKYEIIGGIAFILAGIFYIAMILTTIITAGFEWYYLSWAVQISGIAFLTGALFLVGWFKKTKNNSKI